MPSPVSAGALHSVAPHSHIVMKAVLSSGILWTWAGLGIGEVVGCPEAEVAQESGTTT